jgi:hypothetical protein
MFQHGQDSDNKVWDLAEEEGGDTFKAKLLGVVSGKRPPDDDSFGVYREEQPRRCFVGRCFNQDVDDSLQGFRGALNMAPHGTLLSIRGALRVTVYLYSYYAYEAIADSCPRFIF